MIVVFLVVLVVFGPQKLPELARTFGKLMAEFRKASGEFKNAFEEEMRDLERQAREVERRKAEVAAAAASAQPQPATLATPSGTETQARSAELAVVSGSTETSVPEAGASEGPVIAPVAEGNVAREMETGTPKAEGLGESSEPAETQELQAKAQKADN